MNKEIDNTFRQVFTPNSPLREDVGSSFEILANIFGSIPKDALRGVTRSTVLGRLGVAQTAGSKTLQNINRLIDAFPEIRGRAFAALAPDLGVTKRAAGMVGKLERGIDKWLLAMNRTQEFIIRRGVLSARLDVELRKIGSSLEDMVDHGRIPAGFNRAAEKAITETLFHTFALNPKGKRGLGAFFKAYAGLIDSVPPLAFLEPFPRFIFNTTKLIMENTATGGLRLMSPLNRAKIAEGDFSPFAREMTGTVLFATALAIRTGKFPGIEPGARFDEVITQGGPRASMAPFATIIPHLFLADLVLRIDEGRLVDLSYKDFRQGLLSSAPQIQRVTSIQEGLFKELFQIDTKKKYGKMLAEITGETATGYLRTFQLLRDFREELEGAEGDGVRLQREKKGLGAEGPLRNLLDPTSLPELESPTRGATPKAPRVQLPGGGSISGALFSHISGIRLREARNTIERELVHLGFGSKHISPKTGNKRLDALVNRFQGPILEKAGEILFTTDLYRTLPVRLKQELVRNLLNAAREEATNLARRRAPAAFFKRKLNRMPNIKRRAIEEQMNLLLKASRHKLRFADLMTMLSSAVESELDRQGLGVITITPGEDQK